MDIHEALQTAGQYIYIGFRALLEGLQKLFGMLADWFQSLPWPNAIKLFSNDTANKYLFFGIAIYLLLMNIWAFALFGADKSNAKRKQRRIKESKLMKVCFFGGATGGIIGMNVFRHKTLTMSPAETAIIAADLATKTSNVDLSFVDRFSGTLIITGMVADVETSLRAIMDYAERTLKFTVCEITKT